MKASKIIGIVLIVASIALGYLGISKVAESGSSVEIMDVEINASNKSGKQQGYIYIGLAVLLFGGGIYTFNRK